MVSWLRWLARRAMGALATRVEPYYDSFGEFLNEEDHRRALRAQLDQVRPAKVGDTIHLPLIPRFRPKDDP